MFRKTRGKAVSDRKLLITERSACVPGLVLTHTMRGDRAHDPLKPSGLRSK